MEGMDLDMLAPYISMDDDFQLTFLSNLPEETINPPSSSSLMVSPAVTASRKRYNQIVPSACLSFSDLQLVQIDVRVLGSPQ